MLSVFIKPCLLTLRLLLPRFSFSKQPPHSLTLSTLSTPSSDLHKYSTFTKQSLLHLSTTPLSLTDKILIYSTLKTLHSTTSTHLQTLIISFITYPSLSPPTTPSPSFLGIFLESYSSFSSPCLQYYLNHYSSLSPSPSQELALSRYLSKLPTHKISDPADLWILSQAKQKNKDNLMKLFVTSCLSMGEFIEFMRLFLREVEGRFWEKYLETRYEEPESVEERILLRYMCGLVGIELGEKCRVVLEKVDTKDPKTICMLCELYKTSAETTKQITQNIQFDTTWGYDNIIWISQYLSPSQLLHAHTRLLQTPLPSDPTTLSLYSSRLPPSLHPSLQSYLCSQLSALPSLLHQHTPSDLLYLLSTLPPFPEYALLLAKQCKGGLNWEDTTQLYYYCRLWGLSHEDVDALRIYVVNGYTSMGTARTRIPTSSYYYKLIEIVPAKELFRYKVTFD